jgi:glutamyl-tRNA synthetase
VQEKVRLLKEVPDAVRFLLDDDFPMDHAAMDKIKAGAQASAVYASLHEAFGVVSPWNGESAKSAMNDAASSLGIKVGQMMFPLRVALSGKSGGPDLAVILELLGRDRVLRRLKNILGMMA